MILISAVHETDLLSSPQVDRTYSIPDVASFKEQGTWKIFAYQNIVNEIVRVLISQDDSVRTFLSLEFD